MKIAYIYFMSWVEAKRTDASGVQKKISWQIDSLKRSAIDVVYMPVLSDRKIKKALPFETATINWRKLKNRLLELDGVYLRYGLSDFQMIILFREIKKQKPEFKVVIEMASWPYDSEHRSRNMKNRILYAKDRRWRQKLNTICDRVITYGKDNEILGVETIKTKNGIDMNRVRKRKPDLDKDTLDICFVADFHIWHGADRLLFGLKDYYRKNGEKRIMLHFVGEGDPAVLDELHTIAKSQELKDHVIFYGLKSGEELDHIYNNCHLAVATLGGHRIGVQVFSTLKTREYLAKGIPFFYGEQIDVFLENPVDFAYKIENDDDTPVDFKRIVAFYENLYSKYGTEELTSMIREYAVANVSMDSTLKDVVKYYKEGVVRV